MDFRDDFVVPPGRKVRLSKLDPSFHGKFDGEAAAQSDLRRNAARLQRLQEELYAERRRSLLIVLQGIDAAGKDGTCWHVMSAMNPLGTSVTAFKEPTPVELAHDFLWRVHPHAPARGHVAVFNRSHYEDVLIVRVHGLVPKAVWSRRYDQINAFEELLVESGTTILKFFLLISPEEQLERFKDRLDDPDKRWKISESDYSERKLWPEYIQAFEAMLERCSTAQAPWYVIPSNRKWFRNLVVSAIIADTLDDLGLEMPKPTADLDAIRAAYAEAVAATPPRKG